MPLLEKLKNRLADKPFAIVLIDVGESQETVRRFISDNKVDLQVLLDKRGEVSEKYHVLGHPVKFLIDKKGKLVFQAMGFRQWDSEKWAASLGNFIDKDR